MLTCRWSTRKSRVTMTAMTICSRDPRLTSEAKPTRRSLRAMSSKSKKKYIDVNGACKKAIERVYGVKASASISFERPMKSSKAQKTMVPTG